MFFSVSTEPDYRFWNRIQHLGLWINFDNGWSQSSANLYKGYASNHCRIDLLDNGIAVNHSQPRSFPMWFEHGFITNLYPDSGKKAWVRDSLHMNPDGHIVWTPLPLDLSVPAGSIPPQQAQAQIMHLLDHAVTELGSTQLKLYCTGGLDTFLLYALLTHHGVEFELLHTEQFEINSFVTHNQPALEHYWSYSSHQLHHWNSPAWLATGGCGDEYFLRGPAVIAMLASWHDIDFGTLLDRHPDCYHYYHFKKYQNLWQTSWQQKDQFKQQLPTRNSLMDHVMDNLANDHQHWHLGETMTWTPFKNIEIARILLQCDIEDLIPQFLHGDLTRQIVGKYCPEVLQFVSTYKNHNNLHKIQEFAQWHASKHKVSAH